MRRIVLTFVLIALAALIFVMGPQILNRRFPFAERPYTAVYERNDDGVISTFTISCDGKGHKVGIGRGCPIQGVNDYLRDMHFVLSKNDKKVFFRNLIWSDYSGDEWSIKEGPNVANVGEKTIDGHQCRGWDMAGRFVKVAPRTDSVYFWYDKDTGCLVSQTHTEDNRARAVWEYRLKSLTPEPLPEDAFAIPADYEKVRRNQF